MKEIITEEQAAFFTKNGFIEFAIPHTLPEKNTSRDIWRKDEAFKKFILKKLGPLALNLTRKNQLRLALSQWITKENRPNDMIRAKDMFNIQGITLGAVLGDNPIIPEKKSSLGLLPIPTSTNQVLFFKPEFLLDWPHVSSDICLILFALPNAVYIHNTKDPHGNELKQFGYSFGDALKNNSHPLIF